MAIGKISDIFAGRGVAVGGRQLAADLNLRPGMRFYTQGKGPDRKTRVLILGVNGFIGNALTDRLLQDDRYEVYGMDLQNDKIQRLLN